MSRKKTKEVAPEPENEDLGLFWSGYSGSACACAKFYGTVFVRMRSGLFCRILEFQNWIPIEPPKKFIVLVV